MQLDPVIFIIIGLNVSRCFCVSFLFNSPKRRQEEKGMTEDISRTTVRVKVRIGPGKSDYFRNKARSYLVKKYCPLYSEICVFQWRWKSLSPVRFFATPWTIQSMEFSRPEYWSEYRIQTFPSPLDLPNSGIKPRSPTLQADSLLTEPQGESKYFRVYVKIDRCWKRTFCINIISKIEKMLLKLIQISEEVQGWFDLKGLYSFVV